MKQLIKPYSLLFYVLVGITFFFVGVSYAGYVEAGKNQMLAGGAIVLGYGVISAFFAFIVALFIAFKVNKKVIFRLNIILALAIVAFWSYYYIKYQNRQKAKELEQEQFKKNSETVTPDNRLFLASNLTIGKNADEQFEKNSGLGMFIPDFYKLKPLYFYGNVNFEKSIQEHLPIDSITFKHSAHGGFDIATAPPWLMPDHLKLDYDLLYFNVQTVMSDFLEVMVNTQTKQTGIIDRRAGRLKYWPEFFLSVHSVEFPPDSKNKVHARPFKNSGIISTEHSFMRPVKIKNDWMYVELLNDDFKKAGKGWIQWQKDGELLIKYSLLS